MKFKIILLLFFLPFLLLSQGSSRGAVSLRNPNTPFVAATGESFVSDPAALQSILVNPANIASSKSYEAIFSHTEWIQDIRTEYLSIVAPTNLGSFSLSISNTSVDGIEVRTIPSPLPTEIFAAQSVFFQLTYGIELTNNIRLGIAPKYLYEKIFVDEATGYGMDVGFLYLPQIDGLTFGLSLTNLGSLAAFRNKQTDLPTQMRFGGTYSFNLNEMTFRVASAFSPELETSIVHYSIGGEITYDRTITGRVGYQLGIDTRGFSAGIGIRYSILTIDYAYVPFSMQIGNSHLISIGLVL